MKTHKWAAYFAADNEQGPERGLIQAAADKESGVVLIVRTCRFFEGVEPGVEKVFLDPNIPEPTKKVIRAYCKKAGITAQSITAPKPKVKK